jgi:hypothetical protein
MLKGFDSLKPEVQQQARKNLQEYAKPGGELEKAVKAMKVFEKFDWEDEGPKESGSATATTNTGTNTGSASRTTTSRSSSTSVSPTEAPLTYYIRTRSGTSNETFTNFIHDLDGAIGDASIYDPKLIPYQKYITKLMPSQAEDLKSKHDFLLTVYAWVFDPKDLDAEEEFFATPGRQAGRSKPSADLYVKTNPTHDARRSKINPRTPLSPDSAAHYWKKMISSPFLDPPTSPSQDPPCVVDDSGGRGTTIYVIDDGFDVNSKVAANLTIIERKSLHGKPPSYMYLGPCCNW